MKTLLPFSRGPRKQTLAEFVEETYLAWAKANKRCLADQHAAAEAYLRLRIASDDYRRCRL